MKRDPSRSFKVLGFLAKWCTTRVRTRPTDFNKFLIFVLLFQFFPIPGFHCWFRCDGSMDFKILLLEKRSKLGFYYSGVCSRLSSTIACAPQTDPAAIPWFGNCPAISYQQGWTDIKTGARHALSFGSATLVSEAKMKQWGFHIPPLLVLVLGPTVSYCDIPPSCWKPPL